MLCGQSVLLPPGFGVPRQGLALISLNATANYPEISAG